MAKDTIAKVRQSLDNHVEDFEGHTKNGEIHMSRRELLGLSAKVAGGTAVGTVVGLKVLGGLWRRRNKKHLGFEPKFDVYIYSPERVKELSEHLQKLHNEPYSDKGYMQVGFRASKDILTVDIYQGDPELIGEHVHLSEAKPLVERSTYRPTYTYIVESPYVKNQQQFVVEPNFLDDGELLAEIVKAQKLNDDWNKNIRKSYSKFDVDDRRYNHEEIPQDCEIRLKGSSVTYHIYGVEALTSDEDPDLFAEYWMRRDDFKNYRAFMGQYDQMKDAQERVKAAKAIAAEAKPKAK